MVKKIKTRLTALLCAVALVVSLCPVIRAEAVATPYIEVESTTVYSGGQCTVWIEGYNFEEMALLELEIRYDASVLSVQSTRDDGMDFASVNTSNAGVIRYSGISEDGVSGDPLLLSITFEADENAPAGEYKVSVLVKEAMAYVDDAETDVTVRTKPGTVRIERSVVQENWAYLYLSSSAYELTPGDTVTMTIDTWESAGLAAGQFEFSYDSELFEYVGLELLAGMKTDSYVHTVNTAITGKVSVMYASDIAVEHGSLMRLTLRVKENAHGYTHVQFTPSDLLDENENPLSANSSTAGFWIIPPVNDAVSVWVEAPDRLVKDEVFTVGFWVAGDSALAAGDFSILYDPESLECQGVESALVSDGESLSDAGMVIINDEYSDGAISFSYLNSDGIKEDTCLITAQFRAIGQAFSEVTLSPACTTTPVDKNISPIELECADASGVILGTRTGTCGENLTWALTADGTLTISGEGYMSTGGWGNAPWYECRKYISSVVICDGVRSIGYTAFMDCTALESVVIPASVSNIESYAFQNCSSLKKVVLPEGIPYLEYGVFSGCKSLESITIPGSVTRIYGQAFYGCEMLSEVIFTGGPLQWTFMDIEYSNDVLYRDIVTCTGEDKLSGECGENVTWSLSTDGVLTISGSGYMDHLSCCNTPWYTFRSMITSAVIEDGVLSIGGETFCNCNALENVTIADSVTRIGGYAFEHCTSLKNIYIPGSVSVLDYGVFYDCTALESVVIPEGVTYINGGTFQNCVSLMSVTLPASMRRIENGAFWNCTALTSVIYTGGPRHWAHVYIGSNNDALREDIVTCAGEDEMDGKCGRNVTWSLNDGVLTISGMGAMDNFSQNEAPWFIYVDMITKIIIDDGVTFLGSNAFAGCEYVTSVVVGRSVTQIGYSMFRDCTALTDITLPRNLTIIYDNAFANCTSLESITIPIGVHHLGSSVFEGCTALTSVKIPAQVTSIYRGTFRNCTALESVTIPKNMYAIYNEAFYGCDALTSVEYGGSQSQWENLYIDTGNEPLYNADITCDVTVGEHEHVGGLAYHESNHWNLCDICGMQFNYAEHAWVLTEEKDAQCQIEGYKIYACECGAGYIENIEAWEHVYDEGTVTKEATCTEKGEMLYTCQNAGCGHTKTKTIAAKGHSVETVPGKPATCTEDGLKDGKQCTTCGEILVEQEIIKAPGHTLEIIPGKAANCTEDGLTDGEKCTVCGEITIEQEVIKAPVHTKEVIPSKDATCTETGLTEGEKCSICGEILVEQEIIEALGHTKEVIPSKDATCTKDGLTEGEKCSVCGEILVEQEIITAPGHAKEVLPGKAATCTEDGLTEGEKCTVCGEITIEQEVITAPGHIEEIVPSKEATLTETGLTEGKKCSVCGMILVEQIEIPVLEAIGGKCGEELTWTLTKEGVLTISGTGEMFDYASAPSLQPQCVVPMSTAELEAAPWSEYTALVVEVVIKDGVTSIGDNAFAACENLKKVEIPETVTEIGDDVFSGCEALETVTYNGSEKQWNEIEIGAGNEAVDENIVVCTVQMGDVTGDGVVDVGDAVKLLKAIASKTTGEFSSEVFEAADVTYDGVIDVGDAVKLLKAIASKTTDDL